MREDLKTRARELARSMHSQGLYPWHVENVIEVSSVPIFDRKQMIDLVKSELERLRKH